MKKYHNTNVNDWRNEHFSFTYVHMHMATRTDLLPRLCANKLTPLIKAA